ncbi:hypothetical protein WAK64_00750 [Bacillus spongiae]|uniref:Sporulation protein YpjB n=1 Tax=Bacillus spongiae TaxID=2683610 RepID=A0ABU8H8R3_9BACI
MKKLLFFSLTVILILNYILLPSQVSAYSYGDPGEEQIAEAYKELENHLEQDDWEKAKAVYSSYEKDFNLYFTKTQPDIDMAFETNDKQLLLRSWQAALRLNIERRLHFAEDQFEDYGQAKLLLAKARGTFSVLESLVIEKVGQEKTDEIYVAFDESLKALGNPGLFGIGSKGNDKETFLNNVTYIETELRPLFPIVAELDEGESHLTEENLDLKTGADEIGSSSFWLWFSVGLIVLLGILIIINKRKGKN